LPPLNAVWFTSSGIARVPVAFQPEPTPPLAVRYLMGWASQHYGLAQQ
jgi:hypothetical protein